MASMGCEAPRTARSRWRRLPVLLVGAWFALLLLGAFAGLLAAADEPVSLVDYLKQEGQASDFATRARLYAERVGDGPYRGTLEQNMQLLAVLRGRAPQGAASGVRKAGGTGGKQPPTAPALRTVEQEGLTITYDLAPLRLQLELALDVRDGYRMPEGVPAQVIEPEVLPVLPPSAAGFVSAAVLALKAKQFDDGLYAAVELEVQGGAGGKADLLRRLRVHLGDVAQHDAGSVVVEAAARLGEVGGPPVRALDARVAVELRAFASDALRSKPIGFYTWSPELERIFRQDRMLQSPLEPGDVQAVLAALRADPVLRAAYERMLTLYERLTNDYAYADLRALLAPVAGQAPPTDVRLLPPCRAHETDLYKRLLVGRRLPAGATVIDALIAAVLSGEVSLAPTPDSGWYDRQTWALEPLLRPERTPEAARLVWGERYRAYLVELFKGLLALTRETHIKSSDCWVVGAANPPQPLRQPVWVTLPFTVEPLPTHYARRAQAYVFVREVLREHLGAERLATLHRLSVDGPVAPNLADELDAMERLLRGAAETSRHQLGLATDDSPVGREARATFEAWARALATDPDLARDARMMVPLGRDTPRSPMRMWVFLGWTEQPLDVSLVSAPRLVRAAGVHERGTWDGNVYFTLQGQRAIVAPVVAEIQTHRLLDRSEMRALCDKHKTRSAILKALTDPPR